MEDDLKKKIKKMEDDLKKNTKNSLNFFFEDLEWQPQTKGGMTSKKNLKKNWIPKKKKKKKEEDDLNKNEDEPNNQIGCDTILNSPS
jgi:hypothetical protein